MRRVLASLLSLFVSDIKNNNIMERQVMTGCQQLEIICNRENQYYPDS